MSDQGWALPGGGRLYHFFTAEQLSLCGAWESTGMSKALFEDLEYAMQPTHADCKRCRERLDKRGVKLSVTDFQEIPPN